MNQIIGFNAPLRGEHLAHSALPDAPVVVGRNQRHLANSRAAGALRALARTTDRLANRLDPACA